MLNLLVLVSAEPHLAAQEAVDPFKPDAVLLWGPDYSFSITAEAGWVIDEHIDHSTGKRAGIYPRGVNSGEAHGLTAYMFVKTISRRDRPNADLATHIEQQWAEYIRGAPSATRTSSEPIMTRGGDLADVSCVQREDGSVTVHAYLEQPEAFILIVLVGKTAADVQEQMSVFTRLVESYFAMPIPSVAK
jgi:hypothetical protein